MALKVAVATNSGTVIDRHFGQVRELAVFDVDGDGNITGTGYRPGLASCACDDDAHGDEQIAAVLDSLADCKYVLATRIGPHMVRELALKGVTAFELFGEIAPALVKIAQYEQKSKKERK
jgi:predicted Fe-Mo cluster-binding NifX family protein